RLGYGLLGLCLGGLAMVLLRGRREGLYLALGAKALDFGLAPLLLATRRGGRIFGAVLLFASLSAALGFVHVDRKERLRRQASERSAELFMSAVRRIKTGLLDE